MTKIVVLGAGLSASALIQYLEDVCAKENWGLSVADRDLDLVKTKISKAFVKALAADLSNPDHIKQLIYGSDLVVSMLPASLHYNVALLCLELGIHLATASYLSDELKALSTEVEKADLLFLNECGLDPGIDHLSAMDILDRIRKKGGEIVEFESFTGGLVAPESETNPWRYKFTWNPRNVVLASQGGAVKFIHNGQYKYIPYHRVFRRTEIVEIDDYGKFEGYPNRDSLKYRETYGLHDVKTMFRGTFRRPGFSKAWNCLVQLGATDDSYVVEHSEELTHRQFINTFLAYHPTDSVELKLKQYLKIDHDDVDLWERLESLDLFSNDKVGIANATPAQILQAILMKKWSLEAHERDMVVMWHKITYKLKNQSHIIESSLVTEGEDKRSTAMSKTVGLPLAIACKLLLQAKIKARGCVLPITEEFYTPILAELKKHSILFKEKNYIKEA